MARRIDWQQLIVVASPAYLVQRGTPRRLEDIAGHATVAFRLPSGGRHRPWSLQRAWGSA